MIKFYKKSVVLLVFLISMSTLAFSQTTVSGTIKDVATGEAIPGVNIIVKGTVTGTISNTRGEFSLKVNQAPPFTLTFSYIGYATQDVEVADTQNASGMVISMEEQSILGQEVIVSASRVEQSILASPVTIEKVDLIAIQQASAPEFFDALANVKGVQVNSGSLNMTSINTRGFATIANVRFVSLVDGMDIAAPLLNFPTGNIVGISELDAESMELVPGAASALYGPNAFNGILIMKSKSPFEYQGLSAQFKGGVTRSDAQGESNPYINYSIRYAKAFNNKFAFKVNFSMLQGTDWLSNDYRTDRLRPESTTDLSGEKDFDGLNLYGDETPIPTGVPSIGTIRRTGFREGDLLADDNAVKSIKADGAIHYRITDKIEASYNYRYGGGSSVYQGTEKYVLRGFNQQFHKLELKGDNFFVRGYLNHTDAGDSYNLSALGAYMNEELQPTATVWARNYVLAMQGYFGQPAGNHAAARNFADNIWPVIDPSQEAQPRPDPGSDEYKALVNKVKNQYFQRNPPGAKFIDDSKVYHGEFNYNFVNEIEFMELMVGGNFRRYSLFSDGTIFNEAPEDGTNFQRININEFGVYAQASKTIAESLHLTASLRYDKNENFDGQVTPRVSAVYTFKESHNIRASFQTGFRNPDTQAQFIYFPSTGGTLLGSTEANAARYGVHNGGAWTEASYRAFTSAGGSLNPDGSVNTGDGNLLVTSNVAYVQPEQLKSFEIGYKGLMGSNFLVDINYYFTSYSNFIGGEVVAVKAATTHQGNTVNAGSLYSPYVNSKEDVTSQGIGLGVTYNLPKNFTLTGSYNYSTFATDEDSDFRAGFNTPENKFTVGLGNRKVAKNLGFNINFRWQEGFLWESTFGRWDVPEFGVLDAQVSYKISSLKTIAKLGGTNLLGGDYRTNFGAPFVGQQFYISLTFDEFLR